MNRRRRAPFPVVPLLAACLLAGGCAATGAVARQEPAPVDVRVPAAETFHFGAKTTAPAPYHPPPFFEDDEYRYTGRWLTLFELNFTSGAVRPPAAPPE